MTTGLFDAFRRTLPKITFDIPALKGFGDLLPANLGELDPHDWRKLAEISAEHRVGVTWAPRAEVLQELLDAPDPGGRERVLVDHGADIVADCRASLENVSHPDLIDLVVLAVDATTVYESCPTAAQALATNVLESALELDYGKEKQRKPLYTMLRRPISDEASLLEFRRVISGCGIPSAFDHYNPKKRSPVYSRHGTVHCANANLYIPVNAVKAITLTASWIRQISLDRAV